jgi:phage terminase large subunit-like protein
VSNFLFAVTERELDPPEIDKLKEEDIVIKDRSADIKDGRIGHYYYEISSDGNNVLTNKQTINPYNKIDEVEDAFTSLHETGVFRLVMLDEEKDSRFISRIQDGEFETTVERFPQEKMHLDEALERYPQELDTTKIYIVD